MRVRTLRGGLLAATLALAGMALAMALALIVTARQLQATSAEAASAAESIQHIQQATIELLVGRRAVDPVVRRQMDEALRRALAEADRFVTTAKEAEALAIARARVEEYLVVAGGDRAATAAPHAAAFEAVSRLADINVAQARAADRDAVWWHEVALAIGVGAAIALVVAAVAALAWLRRRLIAPLGALADTFARHAAGQREARAPVDGPDEVRMMAQQFNTMADGLSAQRSSQSTFLAGVAHDLRSPLQAIRLSLAALPGDVVAHKAGQRIARQVTRIDRMVSDLLDMTQIEVGRLALALEPCDVREIAGEVAGLYDAGAPDHPIYVSVPAHPVRASCDPLRLEQALGNLLGNAIKYSPAGSCVHLDVVGADGEIVVEVRDHGVGMTPRDRDALFEPFRRGSTSSVAPGLGLGLFVSRGIVLAHGGTIEVESAVGKGSTFRIRLPAEPAPAVATP